MLAAVVGHSQEEAPLFRTSSNLVVVTVFAKDKTGNAVAGLKKEDFLLLENGKPQAISERSRCQLPHLVNGRRRGNS